MCTFLDSLRVTFIRFSKGFGTSYNDNNLWNTGDSSSTLSHLSSRGLPQPMVPGPPGAWETECLGAGIFPPHLSKGQCTIMLDNPPSNTARPRVRGCLHSGGQRPGLEGCVNLPRPKWQVGGGDCLMSMAELAQARVPVHLGLWTPEPAPADMQEDVVPSRMLATAERPEGSSMGGSPTWAERV